MPKTTSSHSGLTRRSFLKTTGAVAGAAAVAGAVSPSLQALANEEGGSAAKEEIFQVVCQNNCNTQACGLKAHVRDGKLVKLTAIDDAPFEKYDRRPCLRGRSGIGVVYSEQRVKYPLKRVEGTDRGAGEWERISWDQALDEIATKFTEIQEEYGKQAIVMTNLTGSLAYINGTGASIPRFRNVIGATNLDYCLDFALYTGAGRLTNNCIGDFGTLNCYWDAPNAKTIIIWGFNTADATLQAWHFIVEAKEKGSTIIVVDPRVSTTATKADIHVPIKLGTDTAFALSMTQVIISEELYNKEFVIDHTVGPLLVRGDDGQFFMNEAGEYLVWDEQAGAPAAAGTVGSPSLFGEFVVDGVKATPAFQLLKDRADEYAPDDIASLVDLDPELIKKVARIYATNGPARIDLGYGVDRYYTSDVLAHAAGALASITGNIGAPGTGFCLNALTPGTFPGFAKEFQMPTGKMGPTIPMIMLQEIAETGKYAGKDFPVKAWLTFNGNPFSNMVNQREIFDKLLPQFDLIVTSDFTMTDTCHYSDYVLPSTHWYEQYDFMPGHFHGFAQLNERALEPPFETKCNLEVMCELAKRMGYGEHMDMTPDKALEMIMQDSQVIKGGYSLEDFLSKKMLDMKMGPTAKGVVYQDLKFPNKTKRLEFYQPNPKPRMNWGQEIDKEFYRLPQWAPPIEAWEESDAYKKYPLSNIQEHSKWRTHSMYSYSPYLRELDPEPVIYINPDDAAARDIKTGDIVTAYNDRGSVVVKAVLDPGLRPGMTSIPKGWQRDQTRKGSFQELTPRHINNMNVNQTYCDCLIEVKKGMEAGDEQ